MQKITSKRSTEQGGFLLPILDRLFDLLANCIKISAVSTDINGRFAGEMMNSDYSNQVFDLAVALSHVDGDRELLSELVIMFLDDYPRTLEEAQNSILNRDHACLERVAHTLKGRLAFFGIRKTHAQVAELEAMGREKNLAGAWKTLEEIKAAMEEVLAELQSFSQGQSE